MSHLKIKYLFRVVTVVVWWALLICRVNLKDNLIVFIDQVLPVREGVMLKAMLWGSSREIDKEMYNQMITSGLLHILVVSGSNMMLVVRNIVETLSQFLGRKWAIWFGLGVGMIYTEMVGWQLPVIRALLMVSWLYLAQALGRKYDWLRVLILVMAVMLVANYWVVFEVSFWLSFISFAAISFRSNEGVLKSTVRVVIWLLPILAYSFGKVSLISPISNWLVLFLVPVITLGGMVASLVSILSLEVGKLILWGVYPLLKYIDVIVNLMSSWSFVVEIKINWWMMIGWYCLGWGWWFKRRKVEK